MSVKSIVIGWMLLLPFGAVAQTQNNKVQQQVGRAQEIFTSVLAGASSYYVDTIDVQKISMRGINSMLSQLDPYTEYIPEMEAEDFQVMTTGEYAGIGAYIQLVDSTVYVQYPMPGSPAERAGLRMGDAFLEIDGVSVVPGTPTTVSSKLKGPVGTTVKVKVRKLGKSEPEEMTIVRGSVVMDQVVYKGMYEGNIGYIRLASFTTRSAEDVKRAYNELNKEGKMKGLILDLRSNGGGVMEGAIDILSMFVPKGTKVLYTKGRLPQTSQEYFTEKEPIALDMPLVVMINGGSASSSEIVAGALQDLDRAVLVGSKSFGKGLVQSPLPVPYDGILKVTISRYHIPSGRCIQQLDYSHRNPDGSVAAVPDSLTQVFKTVGGREVRDGGGIRPDIEIEGETMDAIVYAMNNQGRLFEFVNQLYLERPTIAKLSEVVISEEEMERFITYLEGSEFEYGEMSKEALVAVERLAEYEGYKAVTKETFDKLKELLTPSLRRDMASSREQAKRMMRGMLAQHYFGQEGQYAVTLETDPTMKGALEVLTDRAKYSGILKGDKK
ncbi:MAG: S41 family peptidase [Bacteroidales bacterium]|uniref:S41 family peptidase n=1 Tax=Porphyromonas sp. TaxID=1924944 RepID=UPI0029724825|nr:S41 family peptidase [Porphyromonas sp.]MDD7438755.1 S41 family peptidase [Bacteroidales bacterium]MDY3067013.1 S41 family peptidase [Porphyromonas sp.]